MSPVERRLALGRLRGYRKHLVEEQEEWEQEAEKLYGELTPARAAKYPDIFERKFEKYLDALSQYERVSDIIKEIDYRGQEEPEVIRGKEKSVQGQGRGVPEARPEQRELFASYS